MHEGAYKFIFSMLERLEPRKWVVELGSRTVAGDWPYSGPVRPLFTDARHYVGVDIVPGPNVDRVGNAATWHGPMADTVVCCETLEHTDEAEAICHNAHAMLGPGGVFLMTTAGEGRAPHSAVDGGPIRDGEFYRNVTRDDLRKWLEPFHFWFADESNAGDIYALAVK
ncbi:MAG TPA: hypothetical protein VMS84_07815 [Mycobacterium sp.]|jgi:hypothetical protein|nr:hypothetical protein [Mycobacterium sp.]